MKWARAHLETEGMCTIAYRDRDIDFSSPLLGAHNLFEGLLVVAPPFDGDEADLLETDGDYIYSVVGDELEHSPLQVTLPDGAAHLGHALIVSVIRAVGPVAAAVDRRG